MEAPACLFRYSANSIYFAISDANDKSKWKLNSVIGYKDNRLLSYPCEYFHSKYPNEYTKQRIVIVMFYKYI